MAGGETQQCHAVEAQRWRTGVCLLWRISIWSSITQFHFLLLGCFDREQDVEVIWVVIRPQSNHTTADLFDSRYDIRFLKCHLQTSRPKRSNFVSSVHKISWGSRRRFWLNIRWAFGRHFCLLLIVRSLILMLMKTK